MNKKEMAAKLATQIGVSQVKAMEILNTIFAAEPGDGILAVELDAGNKVTIPGFGTFGTKTRAARIGTNPSSGAKIEITSKKYAFFKPGKTLKERVVK